MLLEARVAQPVTEAEALRLARDLYGLEASARALPGEYDDNFHLTSADGHAFVLKVMHPARERSFIDLQCRALTHLAQRAPHLAAHPCEWNSSGRSPPAHTGTSWRSRPVLGRDGRGAAIVYARRRASR